MVDIIKNYINFIDNKNNVLKENNYELKSNKSSSIEECNNEAQINNKSYFFSGNDLNLKNYDCYIGNNKIPFTNNLEKISGYLYKTTDKSCNKSFKECLIDSQNAYFNDRKRNELIKLAKILAFKNHLVYNQNYDNLYSQYLSRINNGFEILEDNDLTQKKIINELVNINGLIKNKQLNDLNKREKYLREKDKIIAKYMEKLDNIKTKIENITIENNNYNEKIEYLKIFLTILFLLMIILLLYYIFKNSNKININKEINFDFE
jgi:cbb3-type cytochrome oxidase subunit 3